MKDNPTIRHLDPGDYLEGRVFARKWWNAAGIEVRAGERYAVEAPGCWKDREKQTGAAGYFSNKWLLRIMEGSRRLPDANWFALVAMVHPDAGLEARNPTSGNFLTGKIESAFKKVGKIDAASQRLAVGSGGTLEVDRDGFLYFFANDCDFAYSNNSGFLTVRTTRI